MAAATGVAPSTIGRGIEELSLGENRLLGRVRRPGGGRTPTIEKDPTLLSDLEALIEPTSRGDPERPLRWTCKSLRQLAGELKAQGHQVSHTLVRELLEGLDYSLARSTPTAMRNFATSIIKWPRLWRRSSR